MIERSDHDGKKRMKQPFKYYFDAKMKKNVLEVLDSKAFYPCCLLDAEIGQREIIKTKNNGILMNK